MKEANGMSTNGNKRKTCPLCGNEYTAPPALSRTDNETLICPDCGSRQALESIGVSVEEQDKILGIMHRYTDQMSR